MGNIVGAWFLRFYLCLSFSTLCTLAQLVTCFICFLYCSSFMSPYYTILFHFLPCLHYFYSWVSIYCLRVLASPSTLGRDLMMQKCRSALQELHDTLLEAERKNTLVQKKNKKTKVGIQKNMHTRAQLQRPNYKRPPHVSGASSDKNVASVPHWEQGRESYMIGASIAACRSWHNEFNAIGLIWQPCQHLTASAWKTHTHTLSTQAWVSQTLPGASLHLAKAWLWQTQHLMVGY